MESTHGRHIGVGFTIGHTSRKGTTHTNQRIVGAHCYIVLLKTILNRSFKPSTRFNMKGTCGLIKEHHGVAETATDKPTMYPQNPCFLFVE